MNFLKKIAVWIMVLALTACATATKIDSGARDIDGLRLVLDGAWNEISAPNMNGPHRQTWTMEGLPVDQLLIYSGLKAGEEIHPDTQVGGSTKVFKFKPDMQPDQIVALFEGMLTRDGSTFKLLKLEPAPFGGGKGFRFEYNLTRKSDNVELSGLAGAVVNKGQLFAVVYQAPRLVFYPRHRENVDRIIQSARLL